jgi:hypothetical protein
MGKRSNRQAHREFAAQAQDIRLGDFPVGSLKSRAMARAALPPQVIYTVIWNVPDRPLRLELSFCERSRWPNGEIMELVHLHGRASDLTDEELCSFIERFPIMPG